MRCWRLAFNRYHRGFDREEDWNLRDGTACHAGIAAGRATGNWDEAAAVAEASIRDSYGPPKGLPGEEADINVHCWSMRRTVQLYAEEWGRRSAEVKVIAPECEFEVPLTTAGHLCVFAPPAQGLIPHHVAGRADAVIDWQGKVWFDEFKTTSIWGDRFWDEWLLDIQPTIYMYGIWKALGILPAGFILHGFYKPSASQVREWNSRRKGTDPKEIYDYVKYDRQLFTRTEADLRRLEGQLIDLCDEWEWRFAHDKFPMRNYRGNCMSFGRKCDFHMACLSHDDEDTFRGMRAADPERLRLYHIEAAAV